MENLDQLCCQRPYPPNLADAVAAAGMFWWSASRDVSAAIRALARCQRTYTLTLDLQKAFGYVHPALVIEAMCALGMDYDVCATLQKMSGDNRTKHRWITLGKTMSQSPVAVTTSLPQEDGLSSLAMNAMMGAAIGAIPPHLRRGERQCIFLDGRTVCAKTWPQSVKVWVSNKTQQKALLLCATNRGKQKAAEVGFLENKSSQPFVF